jgi:hypothetical protein
MDFRSTFLAAGFLVALQPFVTVGSALAQDAASTDPQAQIGPKGSLADFARKPAPAGIQLNLISPTGTVAHLMPTPAGAEARAKALGAVKTPLLTYHHGKVMFPDVLIYTIFWNPAKLQNGSATSYSPKYMAVQNNLAANYPSHGVANINTQYFQKLPTIAYVQNIGYSPDTFTDTAAYPASVCTDTATPGNCLTEQQVISEITKVMNAKGWTGGQNKIYLLYTSKGEGSCFDASNKQCAYTYYCAFHDSFTLGTDQVIFGYEPYGDPNFCQSTGVPSPNGDADADTAATAASHEVSEAITDPFGDGWWDVNGDENGDKCAYKYGTNTWKAGTANQMWNGNFFELQMEFSNHSDGCLQVGP